MPESLLMRFDALVARRGLAKNRSEVVRDLVRDALIEEECSMPGEEVMGTLTIVFNHHTGDVRDKLDGIQHEFYEQIVSSMHVHLDADTCMEVIILRGESGLIQTISNIILGTKGVTHGRLSMTSTGHSAFDSKPTPAAEATNAARAYASSHSHSGNGEGHTHGHTHGHSHTHSHSSTLPKAPGGRQL